MKKKIIDIFDDYCGVDWPETLIDKIALIWIGIFGLFLVFKNEGIKEVIKMFNEEC